MKIMSKRPEGLFQTSFPVGLVFPIIKNKKGKPQILTPILQK